jgi:hypothetical protein
MCQTVDIDERNIIPFPHRPSGGVVRAVQEGRELGVGCKRSRPLLEPREPFLVQGPWKRNGGDRIGDGKGRRRPDLNATEMPIHALPRTDGF